MRNFICICGVTASVVVFSILGGSLRAAGGANELVTRDHYVRVKSTVPAIAGQFAELYVREKAQPGTTSGLDLNGRVVLFVHGSGTPAEVAFDVPYQDYSWMAYLAEAGFRAFSMDTTGYGRSTRPLQMNDPCNLAANQQALFLALLPEQPCVPTYSRQLTTIASDWNDVEAVVDYIRDLLKVQKVSLIGWSLGGPRAGGFAAMHPDKVDKLVFLAPAYTRNASPEPPAEVPGRGAPMNTQSKTEFLSNWDRQAGCPGQYDPAVADRVWRDMLDSDPVGAQWGDGVRRAPLTTTWGWNASAVTKSDIPTLMVSGANDKQVAPDSVRNLYADLGASKKVFIDLACSSHMAMWEKNHLLLFKTSLDWLKGASVNGTSQGMMRMGY